MKKAIIAIGIAFSLMTISHYGYAATAKCTVAKKNGNTITLQCSQVVGDMKKGDQVKVRTVDK